MDSNCTDFMESDCRILLGKYYCDNNQVKLLDFKLEPISNKISGYLSQHLRLKIKVLHEERGEVIQLFVKTTVSTTYKSVAEFIVQGNMFYKEISWYRFLQRVKKYCPNVDLSFSPTFYFARDNKLIVLEDLALDGFKLPNTIFLDSKHLRVMLSSLAKCHAISIIYEEEESRRLGRRYRISEDYKKCLEDALYRIDKDFFGYKYVTCGLKALQALIDLIPERGMSSNVFKEKLKLLVNQVFEHTQPSSRFRNVWCNGDVWANNAMFQYNNDVPVSCKIFDFQMGRYNPPTHDVLSTIYESTSRKEKQQYLMYYYEELQNKLKSAGLDISKIISKEEYEESCSETLPAVAFIKAVHFSLTAMSIEKFQNILENPDLYNKCMFEDRSELVVNLFKMEEQYRKRMSYLIGELNDMILHHNSSDKLIKTNFFLA